MAPPPSHQPLKTDPTFTARARSTWEVVRRVAHYIRPYKLMAAGTTVCALLSLAFSLAYPKLIQFVVDKVIGQKRVDLLVPAMLGLLGAFLFRDLFNGLRILINNVFEQNVIYNMRRDLYARLQRLPVNYFDQRASGHQITGSLLAVIVHRQALLNATKQTS